MCRSQPSSPNGQISLSAPELLAEPDHHSAELLADCSHYSIVQRSTVCSTRSGQQRSVSELSHDLRCATVYRLSEAEL